MSLYKRNILLSAAALAMAAAAPLAHASSLDWNYLGRFEPIFRAAEAAQAGGEDTSLAVPKYGTWGFDASGMDRSVKPGDDFFRYANGKWADRTVIPPDRTRYGNFDKLAVLSENRVHAILEDAAAGKLNDPDAAKIGAAYKAFMNEALADKLDAKPIRPALAEIKAVKSKDQFTALMGKSNTTAFTSILPVGIGIDQKNPHAYAVHAITGGLGLPDRDYYLQPAFAAQKAKYQAYVAQMLTMAGWPNEGDNTALGIDNPPCVAPLASPVAP